MLLLVISNVILLEMKIWVEKNMGPWLVRYVIASDLKRDIIGNENLSQKNMGPWLVRYVIASDLGVILSEADVWNMGRHLVKMRKVENNVHWFCKITNESLKKHP
jgi:hypothetical protein